MNKINVCHEVGPGELEGVEGGIWPLVICFVAGALLLEVAHHH